MIFTIDQGSTFKAVNMIKIQNRRVVIPFAEDLYIKLNANNVNFTPPPISSSLTAVPGTVLLTCQDDEIKDNSIPPVTITPYGDVRPGGGVRSVYFDGVGDYLTADVSTTIGTNDFTFECWVHPTAAFTSTTRFFLLGPAGGRDYFTVYFNASGNVIYTRSGVSATITSTGTVPLNKWTHIAVSRSSGMSTIYINGNASGGITDTYSWPAASNAFIGTDGQGNFFTGYVSNLRLVNGSAVYASTASTASTYDRGENYFSMIADENVNEINLPFKPLCTEFTEVYVDGIRLLNPRMFNVVGGTFFQSYNVSSNVVIFNSISVKGFIEVISDTKVVPEDDSVFINFKNAQGVNAVGLSLYCEPVVVTRPENGYARLSLDRKSLVYRPKINFNGIDSFSYCLINNHGQQSKVACIYIQVGEIAAAPPPPAPPPPPPPFVPSTPAIPWFDTIPITQIFYSGDPDGSGSIIKTNFSPGVTVSVFQSTMVSIFLNVKDVSIGDEFTWNFVGDSTIYYMQVVEPSKTVPPWSGGGLTDIEYNLLIAFTVPLKNSRRTLIGGTTFQIQLTKKVTEQSPSAMEDVTFPFSII